jgi:cytochrome c556
MIKFRKSIAVAALAVVAGAASAQQSAGVLKLMRSTVIPHSNIVFSVSNKAPKNDAEWAAVQRSAVRLADVSRQLVPLGPDVGREAWMQFLGEMRDAARKTADAAKTRNVDGVVNAGDTLFAVCEGCHAVYWKK